jgi:hypothetical protein
MRPTWKPATVFLWNLGLLVSNAGLRDVRFAAENVRYPAKADIRQRNWHVRFGPKAINCLLVT